MAGKRKFSGGYSRSKKLRQTRRTYKTGRQSIIKTSRTVEYSPITIAASDVNGALAFKLSDLPNYTDFDIFDEYMITGVKVMFVPSYTDAVGTVSSNTQMPMLLTAIDYDDNTALAKDALCSNESCMVHRPGVKCDRFLKPMTSTTYWQSAVATGFGSNKRTWLDTQGSPGVTHYGLKYVCSPSTAAVAAGLIIRIFVKYYISFRKVVH